MKVEYISPFVVGASSVIQSLLNIEPKGGTLGSRPKVFTSQQVNVVCGIVGTVEGQVIYGMSVVTADKIASLMVGSPIVTFDALAASAIAELGNMISGSSLMQLAAAGYECDITPPTIIRGSNVKISTMDIPALVIPFSIEGVGDFEITVSLQERIRRAA